MYTLEVLNITKYIKYPIKDLELLGRGTQGSVYKIDEHKCIKIFKKTKPCFFAAFAENGFIRLRKSQSS